MKVYRIVLAEHTDIAFDGQGASKFGGRWNSKGVRVVYTSGSLSLAVLEILAHITPGSPRKWAYFECQFPSDWVAEVSVDLSKRNWKAEKATLESQSVGDDWIRTGTSAVLRVPSTHVPIEFNYLLNPLHAKFAKIDIGKPQPLKLDPRLTAR